MIKLLEECKKCNKFKSMKQDIVVCNRLGYIDEAVLSMPSHRNKGFENGVKIVDCFLEKRECSSIGRALG